MGLVNLKEMAKRLKRTEEEVMAYVDSGIIKPPAYCHPAHFGDGRAIAFYPEQVLVQIEAKKREPKVKEPEIEVEEEKVAEPAPEQKEEPETEQLAEEESPPEQPTEQAEDEKADPFEEAKKEIPKKDKKKK